MRRTIEYPPFRRASRSSLASSAWCVRRRAPHAHPSHLRRPLSAAASHPAAREIALALIAAHRAWSFQVLAQNRLTELPAALCKLAGLKILVLDSNSLEARSRDPPETRRLPGAPSLGGGVALHASGACERSGYLPFPVSSPAQLSFSRPVHRARRGCRRTSARF